MIMQKERNYNLDIIRTAAILFVLTVHFYDNSGFPGESLSGISDMLMLMGWLITHSCVPLFLMLSGWLCCGKKLSPTYYLGLVRILLLYLICSAACLVFRALWLGEELGLRYVFGSLVNFYACGYAWYVMLYFGLFLMIPFLNLAYSGLDSRGGKLALVATMFALSVLPSLLNQFVQLYSLWWVKLFPLCYYFLGAYLKEYSPRLKSSGLLILLLAGLLAFSAFDLFFYRSRGADIVGISYENYQVFFVSLLLFSFIVSLPAQAMPRWAKSVFASLSEQSFSVYLMSWIADWLIYPVFVRLVPNVPDRFVWMLPCALISLAISYVLALIADAIYKPLRKLCLKLLYIIFPVLKKV